ncbi:MAG: hypothetical protein M3Y77_20785 [Actinomycetota bacterium]|nr:hypothetical protein [Actinomycetota bacterium]
MSQEEKFFEPTQYGAGAEHGLLSPFEPGTRTLSAGAQLGPRFRSLPADIVLDKDVAVAHQGELSPCRLRLDADVTPIGERDEC